jgi:hypothetical protein
LNELVLAGLHHSAHLVSLGLVQAARLCLGDSRDVALRLSSSWRIYKPLVDVNLALASLLSCGANQKTSLLEEAREAALKIVSEAEQHLDVAVCEFRLDKSLESIVEHLNAALHASRARSTVFNTLMTAAAVFGKANIASSAHKCLLEASKIDDRSARPLLGLAALYIKGGRFALAQRA